MPPWKHPEAIPFLLSAMLWAKKPLIGDIIKLLASCETNTKRVSNTAPFIVNGVIDRKSKVITQVRRLIIYHFFKVSHVSTIGAHKNLNILADAAIATILAV
jgi:hypothetical protein